jgi:transcriptional regulator with XRE-family HTH domain
MPRKRNDRLRIVGPAVRAIREAQKIRLGVFARDVGITPSFLSHIERDGYQPSDLILAAIADRLGLPVVAITVNLDRLEREQALVDEARAAKAAAS